MTSPNAPAPASDKLDGAVLKIASVVVLGAIMSILDVTVVSVALTTFAEDFETSYATVAWTMTAYTLALATVIPVTGWAADRFGTKRLYMTALVLFVLGSVACAMAWDITSLIGFRVLQGLGGGMLMPLGMTIMTRAAGPDRVGRVMAVLGIPMLLGPIGGPILGGWLIEAASWHWIFLINLPIGIIALAAAFIILPSDKAKPSESFDFLGMILLSPGLALFLFGVSSIPEVGTVASARVLVSAGIGLALIIAFVFHALNKDHPLIDLHLFKKPSVDHRRHHDVAVHRRVHGRRVAVPELLHPGRRSHHARCRIVDGSAGSRRYGHHAHRWSTGRQDRPGQDRPDRFAADSDRLGCVHTGCL